MHLKNGQNMVFTKKMVLWKVHLKIARPQKQKGNTYVELRNLQDIFYGSASDIKSNNKLKNETKIWKPKN